MKYENKYKVGKLVQQKTYLWAIIGLLIFLFTVRGPAALATPTPQTTPGDWSTYLSDNGHSGFNGDETIINPTTAPGLKLHWTYHAKGAISAQPVAANNLIYWGSWDGLEHATDLNGNEVWATSVGKTHACGSTIGVASTATLGFVTISGQTTAVVFVGGGDAHFYALNAVNGNVIWKIALGSSPSHFIWSSPIVYNGSVYIGMASFGDCPAVRGQLIQMNAASGAIQHIFNVVPKDCIGGGVWSSPTIDSATGKLYIATGSPDSCSTTETYVSAVIELRASNLALVSSWQVPQSDWVIDSDFGATPTLFTAKIHGVSRALVGVAHKNGLFYAFVRGAISNGPVWRAKIASGGSDPEKGEGSISSSAWDGSRLYVAGGDTSIHGHHCRGSLRALNPATGAFLWEHCLPDGPVLAPVIGMPGVAAVEEGRVVTLINAASGKTLFVYKDSNRGSIFDGGSSISHGVLYVGNFDGNLYAFGL